MNTTKHIIKIAEILASQRVEYQHPTNHENQQRKTVNEITKKLSRYFKTVNPLFDSEAFFDHITKHEQDLLDRRNTKNENTNTKPTTK